MATTPQETVRRLEEVTDHVRRIDALLADIGSDVFDPTDTLAAFKELEESVAVDILRAADAV